MNSLKKFLITLSLLPLLSLNAMDFRIGPKVGVGFGSPLGLSEGDAKVAVGFPIGGLAQFDFGNIGIDVGLNYRYSVFGIADDVDQNGDLQDDLTTVVLGYSSFEIPVTAYYALRTQGGFFKFGGGLGFDFGVGKVKVQEKVDFSNGDTDTDVSTSESFSKRGLSQHDIYLIAHFGYQMLFDKWALSIDLQPKYGLINKIKNQTDFDNNSGASDKWNTLWFDLSVGFLF